MSASSGLPVSGRLTERQVQESDRRRRRRLSRSVDEKDAKIEKYKEGRTDGRSPLSFLFLSRRFLSLGTDADYRGREKEGVCYRSRRGFSTLTLSPFCVGARYCETDSRSRRARRKDKYAHNGAYVSLEWQLVLPLVPLESFSQWQRCCKLR